MCVSTAWMKRRRQLFTGRRCCNDPYTPTAHDRRARSVTFAIRTERAGNEGFLSEVQQAVWSVNANLPVASAADDAGDLSKSMARTSFTLVMLAIAGRMALLLGVIGIYGVISYAVSQRTREIGIRLALGAQKSELSGCLCGSR